MTSKRRKQIPYRNCGVFIGVLGFFQALIWIIITGAILACFFGGDAMDDVNKSMKENKGKDIYWGTFYDFYLAPSALEQQKTYIYCCLFMFLSVVWFLLSMHLYCQACCEANPKCPYRFWAVWTLLICVLDLIVAILVIIDIIKLANDRDNPASALNRSPKTSPHDPYEIRLAVILGMFAFVARGFLLWVLNLVCSILLLMAQHSPKKHVRIKREDMQDEETCPPCMSRLPPPQLMPPPCSPGPCTDVCAGPAATPTCGVSPPLAPTVTLNMIKDMFLCSDPPDDDDCDCN